IRQSLEEKDILNITVEEVRRVMGCDRVLVYSLNEDRYGTVIAESVAAKYTKALNKVISDPCFETKYLEKYRDGRVRALDNIYEAEIPLCYLEQLESLEVKANLVTPIINEGKLFGLLVAHQCSESRHWQDYEIRWLTQIATQVGFALDNAKVLRELNSQNISTQLLNSFIFNTRHCLDRVELFKTTVEQVCLGMSLDRVIVYQFDADWNGTIISESVVPGYAKSLNSHIQDSCFAQKYQEKYLQGYVKAISNIHEANLTECYLEKLEFLQVKAIILAPIIENGELFGLLIGHQCSKTRDWESSEIELFYQLTLQLGLALERVALKKELSLKQQIPDNQVTQPLLEQQSSFPKKLSELQKLSELLVENQHTLHKIKVKIGNKSSNKNSLVNKLEAENHDSITISNDEEP
ncbi:MAG: GAF domain-containing protein, partial [Xenococcaceae cyanobacterium MO_188.B19]|nr:GAF domain-containing protein [Xenococcaceae cyanobacterium MO_188.B19]